MRPSSIVSLLASFAEGLRFRELFLLVTGLLVLDLIIPDMIPMIDEILLTLLAVILANIKKRKIASDDNVVEGEVIDDERPDQAAPRN